MTAGQFQGKVNRKQIIEGVHYFIRDRGTWVDVAAMEAWVRNEAYGLNTKASKSGSHTGVRRTRVSSINRGTGPIALKPVV